MWPLRRVLLQAQIMALTLTSAYMAHTALGLLTNCKSPVVVVLSGSMEPGIHRGDLLFLSNYMPQEYRNGDITVYQVPGDAITIVHRVVQTHEDMSGSPQIQRFLTKGDNNDVDDLTLYKGLERLERTHVVGKVRCIIPLVGYASILFNEYPQLRTSMFGLIALLNLLPA
ncbi:signal peptidase complex catalytic subunit SEC11 [Mycena rosella]|uniref:Signal peptidase complex catalytic subunit SEC11 n=1 Tax=Mycena rosella TaxID=1033263 RepID=A0AAD7G5W0_MYCRO|nr:signal peptidase complex catalytic subunit SEC11 [Mycena rosella]